MSSARTLQTFAHLLANQSANYRTQGCRPEGGPNRRVTVGLVKALRAFAVDAGRLSTVEVLKVECYPVRPVGGKVAARAGGRRAHGEDGTANLRWQMIDMLGVPRRIVNFLRGSRTGADQDSQDGRCCVLHWASPTDDQRSLSPKQALTKSN